MTAFALRPTSSGLVVAALCAALPVTVAATPYDGIYRQRADADCALVGAQGGALRIAGGVFTGVGAACEMTRPVDVLDMDATIYTMECTGNGDGWTERAIVMNTAEGDGIIMVWNGYAFRYDRCPAPGAVTGPADVDAPKKAAAGPDAAGPDAGDADAAGDPGGNDDAGQGRDGVAGPGAPVTDRTP